MQERQASILTSSGDDDSAANMELSGEIDVRSAENLRTAALEVLASGKPVRVDCSKVEFLDLSAFQILLALRRDLKQRSLDLELANLPDGVRTTMERAGLGEHLLTAVLES